MHLEFHGVTGAYIFAFSLYTWDTASKFVLSDNEVLKYNYNQIEFAVNLVKEEEFLGL